MNSFAKELAWIDGQRDRLIGLVTEWSKINSGSYHLRGIERMGKAAEEVFKPLGAEFQKMEPHLTKRVTEKGELEETLNGAVYRFSKTKGANRKVLLTGHLDTVFPEHSGFQRPVFLNDNTLNGPGVADMKGGILVMLVALEALERSKYAENLGFEVLLNSDEEIGSKGSTPIFMERARDFNFGMTFEPALADGTLAGERKGSGDFTIVVRGKAAHAGREFEKGVNAVHGLGAFIVDLFTLNGTQEGLTINPANLIGGDAPNIVPDLAIMVFNVRVKDKAQMDWFDGKLSSLVASHSKAGITVERHGFFTRPPKTLTPANTKLFEVLKKYGADLGVKVSWKPTGGCCDGNNLAAAGLPNIDTLGVRGGKIHTHEEFALLDSFTERAKLSALLLLNYAAGNFDL